jgi:hypothetical protein
MKEVTRRRNTGSLAIGFIVAVIVLLVGILCYMFLLGNIEQIPADPGSLRTPYAHEEPLTPQRGAAAVS